MSDSESDENSLSENENEKENESEHEKESENDKDSENESDNEKESKNESDSEKESENENQSENGSSNEDANDESEGGKFVKPSEDMNTEKHKCDDVTWKDLGLSDVLCEIVIDMKWLKPTKIQKEAIPVALKGNDIIGLAETGSGKTGAFALPIMQSLFETPQKYFALVLTPTRELAFQISEQFEAIGSSHGLKCCVIVGGMDMVSQALQLAKRPHIVVATPGRLVDHLENTKGFTLNAIKYLVMDEADRILNMDFELEVNKILKVVPKERRTYLFSATMTKKVKKLQRASLQNPVLVEVSNKFQTVATLQQYYLFIPLKFRDVYLVYILNELAGNSFMIFCGTCAATIRIALMIRALGMAAIPLHGQMSQNKRLAALNKFKSKSRSILVSTDVASRGLDIPHVDVVINYDIPTHSKDYIHRVGRTARNGAAGQAMTLVTQYDVELFQRIEHLLGYQLPIYKLEEESVMMLQERVAEAQRTAKLEQKNLENSKLLAKEKRSIEDEEEMGGLSKRAKIFNNNKSFKRSKFKKKK